MATDLLSFSQAIKPLPAIYQEALAAEEFQVFQSELEKNNQTKLLTYTRQAPVKNLITSLFGSSPYLSRLIRQNDDLLEMLFAQPIATCFEELCAQFEHDASSIVQFDDMMALLRLFKKRASLLIALGDIGRVWDLMQVTSAVSRVADLTLQWAIRFLFKQAVLKGEFLTKNNERPDEDSGFIVLGMGKYGAFELNYSSDIDLIILFDGDVITLKEDLNPQIFCVKLTKQLLKLMQHMSADGYVFRTDLRLRPDPGATQIAMSVNAAYSYYENFGQNWERAAMIKARPVAGDIEAGNRFLTGLSSYIWRKYLDFAAIGDIHAMKRQIHAVKGHMTIAVEGHNLKLGRGGIREIEFFVQTQQLIAGGRQDELRGRATLKMLQRLCEYKWIDQTAVNELTIAYNFLRTIEHRLQMINDEQTHALPIDEDGLQRIALFSGFETFESFSKALVEQLSIVESHYVALFEDTSDLSDEEGNLVFAGESLDGETSKTLSRLGYAYPNTVFETVSGWHFGRYPCTRSTTARERLTEFQPKLIHMLADTADPDGALVSFDKFLSKLPAGIQLFSLLSSNPTLLRLLADIMGTAPRLAHILSQKAKLLDAVLDPAFFETMPRPNEIKKLVTEDLSKCGSYEEVLDQARITGREQRFLIGVRLLSGTLPAVEAGFAYSALAEGVVASLLERVEQEFAGKHGRFKDQQLVVLGMGKLGGRELSTASDLDLILIYDVDDRGEGAFLQSDGERPLSVAQYFSRLTQRLISALSAPTAEGVMYEVDMRLRPSGNSGPVATRLNSFDQYQREESWTWEHLALSRARVIAGDQELATKVEATIDDVLQAPKDHAKLTKDTLDMRETIFKEKGSDNCWDIKNCRGGMVEVEFIAQFLQLIYGETDKNAHHTNTIEALTYFRETNRLSLDDANDLIQAIMLYHNLTHLLRLCLDGAFDPKTAPSGFNLRLAQAGGQPDIERLQLYLIETQSKVAQLFQKIISI